MEGNRLIPGKTNVKIEIFRGVGIGDVIVGIIGVGFVALMLLSTFPFRIYISIGIAMITAGLLLKMDDEPMYMFLLHILRYLSYPKDYGKLFTDKQLIAKTQGVEVEEVFGEKGEIEPLDTLSPKEKKKQLKALIKEENKILKSKTATDEEKNEVWKARAKRNEEKKKKKSDAKDSVLAEEAIEKVIPFTGIADGFIEYDGKYYGTIIEIDPVEFRFFSEYRRNNSIEDCLGKVLRAVKGIYAVNIIKLERPIIYDKYLAKEYDRLDELRASYEKGMLTEEELKARVEIEYDRIEATRQICFEEKVIQPHYYIALFNSDKKQLTVETNDAVAALEKGELTVRQLTDAKDLAVFLKYTNYMDFEERDIEKIDPEDYLEWAMPEDLSFTMRTAEINGIITHQMRVIDYPSTVGDAWMAGLMSIPGTKVVVKASYMDRAKAIRSIDRSLQELRGKIQTTSIDSKIIELQSHIETLSDLLVTLNRDNEALMTANVYVSMYDAVLTGEDPDVEGIAESNLPVIADMKKLVKRTYNENGLKLSNMDLSQMEMFIASQVSAYDPFLKAGRGIPSNTIAAMFPWIYANISDEGGIRMGDSEGVPVYIDFFRRDSERINSNMVIIGKSGAGKSFGTKSLLVNMAAEDAKIFILDPENEYTELAHNLGGKIINVGNAKQGRLNPFHIITALEDDEAGTEEDGGSFSTHMQFLEEFLRQILPDVDNESLEYLNSLVERTYTNRGISMETDLSKLAPEDYPIFDDLYDVVLEEFERINNEYLRTMLQTLMNYVSKFATGGRNANIWNGPSSITTDENFSVFNFQSLLANRNTTIANAQMLLVLKYIDNEVIKNRDYNRKYGLKRKVVVVIDEAHVFIDTKFPVALDFMFQLAKRIRKYNGMQIVITQNIKDFVGSEEIARKSTAIINACQYSFIFGLAPNDMDDLCKLYEKAGGINPQEQEQILAAPRGQAFTIMGPASRSSFKVGVPANMVEIFEKDNHSNTYFTGEGGDENWEEFIKDSREKNAETLAERKLEEEVNGVISKKKKKSSINFSEITFEEAKDLAVESRNKRKNEARSDVPLGVGSSGGISFSIVSPEEADLDLNIPDTIPEPEDLNLNIPDTIPEPEDMEFNIPDTIPEPEDMEFNIPDTIPEPEDMEFNIPDTIPEPEDMEFNIPDTIPEPAPQLDMSELIAQIREEVRKEVEKEMEALAPKMAGAAVLPTEEFTPQPEFEEPAAYEPEDFESDFGLEEPADFESDFGLEEPADFEPDYGLEEPADFESDFDFDETADYGTGDEDFGDFAADIGEEEEDFDFMALFHEQLDSYAELSLDQKMDELEVDFMEITLDELGEHIKSSRKNR